MASTWTDHKEIKHILLLKWDKGYILRNAFCNDDFFPISVKLAYPNPKEVAENLSEVLEWRKKLIADSKSECGYGYEVLEKEFHYSVLGKNSVPTHFYVATLEGAIKIIGKQKELDIFSRTSAKLLLHYKSLHCWIKKIHLKSFLLPTTVMHISRCCIGLPPIKNDIGTSDKLILMELTQSALKIIELYSTSCSQKFFPMICIRRKKVDSSCGTD